MNNKELLNSMTLEEKASLLCGESFFGSREISKYGIRRLQFLDGGTGMNFEQLFGDLFRKYAIDNGYTDIELDNVTRYFFETHNLSEKEKTLREEIYSKMLSRIGNMPLSPACYPPGITLASTWNRKLLHKVGNALGMEASLYGIECLLGTPNINLLRDPRNGRFFEGYSEDPFLTGELGSELVKGVEEEGVAANVKHFAANNLEINRSGINQIISKRALMELYLPAFKKCLQAGAATVMTSYPSINGKPCVNDSWLLREILRDDWEYTGVNMTDWGACTGDSGDSINSGIDLLMPGPWDYEGIVKAVNDGRLSMENLDEACLRMLDFVTKYDNKDKEFGYTSEEYLKKSEDALYEAILEGIVVLKNEGNLFPVNKDTKFNIFASDDIRICGGGSAQVFTDRKISVKEAFADALDHDYKSFASDPSEIAVVFCSLDSKEGSDRTDLGMDSKTIEILNKLIELKSSGKGGKIALVLNTPGPVLLNDFISDIDAVFVMYYGGSRGLEALRDIFYGSANPSGKLTCTWPVRIEDMPSYIHYPDGFTSYYGEGIYVGYRGYEKSKIRPLFPFGYGLSYSDFKISDVKSEKNEYELTDEVTISFTLENIGCLDGKEVVELYVSDPSSKKQKPVKELKAFDKYFVKAGEKISRELKFAVKDLASFDEDFDEFLVEDGLYDIYIGTSSDISEKALTIRVTDGDIEYRIGLDTPIRELMEIPELYSALKKEIKEKGLSEIDLIMNERYTPANSLNKIYSNANVLMDFVSMCRLYKKP